MADFDLDSFLDARLDAEAGTAPAFDPSAFADFGNTFPMKGTQKQFNIYEMAEQKRRNIEESLVGKLGITPGATGTGPINLAASLASGTSRVAGQLVNLPLNFAAQMGQAGVSEEAIQAYNREITGNPLEGDDAILNQIAAGEDGVQQTMRDRLIGVQGLRDAGKAVQDFFDISSIVDTTDRDAMSRDIAERTQQGVALLRESGDQLERGQILDALLSGAAGATQTVAGAVAGTATNPSAVTEYTVENAPQLAAAAVSAPLGVATNVGYAADELREGYREYAEANDGQLPDQEDRLKMGAFAASLAMAEQVGDLSMLRGIRGEAGLLRSTLSSSAREGVTEGYQTYGEAQVRLDDASIEEIVEGAAIGAAVGGSLNIAGRAVRGASGAKSKAEQAITDREAVATARETGDIADLTNIESENYNPAGAVSVLHEQVLKNDTPEVRESVIAQADTIEQELAKQISDIESIQALASEEGVARLVAAREQREAQLEQATPEERTQLEAQIESIRGLEEEAAAYTPELRAQDDAELKDLNQRLKATREAIQRLHTDAAPTAPEVEELVAQAPTSPEAAERVITLTMTNPDSLSNEQIASMVSDESNGLSPEYRTALRSFAQAKEAMDELKSLSGVRTDIEVGGDGFKGIPQYRNAVRMALSNGNIEAATAQVDQLRAFADTRLSKFAAISDAFDKVQGTQDFINIIPNQETGVWEVAPEGMTPRQVQSAKGLRVFAGSQKLRDAVAMEATALARTAESLQALINAGPLTNAVQVAQEQTIAQEQEVAPVAEEVTPVAEPTAQVSEEAVAQEAESVQAEPVPEVETGELTAIREGAEVRGKPLASQDYQDTNLVGAFFQQSPAKQEGDTKKPLASVKDFATAVRTGSAKLAEFAGVESFTGQQQSALKNFMGFQRMAKPLVEANLKQYVSKSGDASRYRFRDYAQFLVNADGSLDENVSTAIAYAAYDWINDAASNLVNSDAGINAILGKDASAEVSPAAYAALATVGVRQATAAAQLGAKVREVLGLEVLPNAPVNEQARLEASLGEHALHLLVKSGAAKITAISDAQLKNLMGFQEKPNAKVQHYFLTPVSERVDGKLQAGPLARRVREATMGSQSILNKLFGTTPAMIEPSFEPIDFKQRNAKRTQQPISSEQARILDKAAKQAHTLRPEMWQVWGNLSPEALATIAGAADLEGTKVHKANRAGLQAKSDGLVRQIQNFGDFFNRINEVSELGTEQPLYFDRSVWKPQRVGLTSNLINPQTSKVHRHMLKMEGWESEVKLDSKADLDNFKLRVLESFGKKTEATNTDKVLAKYDATVNTPTIQGGVAALAEILRGDASDTVANESAILAAVAEAGENFFSLDGLVALAQEKIAREDGAASFKTTLLGEVDGVTNGPMLSLLMSGAKGFETLNQGGFFSQTDGFQQFNDFHAEAGNLDLYEGTIKAVLDILGNNPLLSAIEAITGELSTDDGNVSSKGRKVIKQPLTAMMFGSNTKTAVDGMADGFIETIYSKIEDAANANDLDSLRKTINAVNQLMIGTNAQKWPTDMGFEAALDTTFDARQVAALKNSFYQLLGKKVEEALNDTYAEFISRRDVINKTANMAFQMYEAAFQAKREQMLKTADLPRGKDGQPYTDLTREQIEQIRKELKPMEPILHTAFSKDSGELDAGMLMAKTRRELNDTPLYRSEVHFAEPLEFLDSDGRKRAVNSMKASGMTTVNEGPGVAPFITATHALDSFISHNALDGASVLNIHDAHGTGLSDMAEAGRRLNEATFKAMLSYSAASEMVDTFERTLAGFNSLMADPEAAAVMAPMMQKYLESQKATVGQQLEAIRRVAEAADTDKLTMLSEMAAVGQYATEGGSYLVTDADRKAAQDALKQVGKFNEEAEIWAENVDANLEVMASEAKAGKAKPLSSDSFQTLAPATSLNTMDRVIRESNGQLREDLQQVASVMESQNIPLASAKEVLPEDRAAAVVATINESTRSLKSVWGELGQAVTPSEQDLVEFLSSEGVTARNLSQYLEQRTQDGFTKKLLAALSRLTREDLPVIMVTPQTGPDGALGEGVSKARGWYASKGNFDAIYVKSPDFVESGITEEFLVHELLHTVTGRVIQRELDAKAKDPSHNTAASRMVDELEEIRSKAQDFLNANGTLSSKYANAVQDVHELVSWGMTNKGFQEEVLKGLELPAKGRDKGFTAGLRRFISALTGLVFRGENTPSNQNAMGLLISNTAGLFVEAQAMMAKKDTMTLRYEDAVDSVNRMSTKQIFNALASNRDSSVAHQNRLADALDNIVAALHGPMGALRTRVMEGQALTNTDVVIKAMNTNTMPFASEALSSAFVVSDQEAFVLEQVEATIDTALNGNEGLFIRGSLENLWREARDTLSARDFHQGDWTQASQQEKAIAQEKYDFLFKVQASTAGKNSFLARFAGLAIGSEEVFNALGFRSKSTERALAGMTLSQKVMELFRRLLTRLGRLHDNTSPGELANNRLVTLLDRLVDIEAKRRGRFAERKLGALDQVEQAMGNVGESLRNTIEQASQSTFFTNNNSPFIRVAGSLIETTMAGRVDGVLEGISRLRDDAFRKPRGVLMGVLDEMRGVTDLMTAAHSLFKQAKSNEMERKQHIEYTVAQVNASFKDGGEYLTNKDKAALTKVFLRTNMSALLDTYGFDGLRQLLNNDSELRKERSQLETQLLGLKNGAYYLRSVKDLAYNRAIGGNVSPNLMLNTQNIADLIGTKKALSVSKSEAKAAKEVMDLLLPMITFEYTSHEDKVAAREVLRTEAARGKDNGVEMILKLHKGLQDRSKSFLFEGTERLMIDGYTPDIFDNKIEVLAVDATDLDYFLKRGYTRAGNVQEDKAAGLSAGKVLVSRRGSGQVGLLTGAMSYTGMQAKGSRVERSAVNMLSNNPGTAKNTIGTIRKNIADSVDEMFTTDATYDPRKAQAQRVAPVLDPNGIIVDYRYMMTEHNRDSLLNRDNSMDQVLGTLAGQIVDKVSSHQQNVDVVRSMYEQFREDYSNRPSSYIKVGKDSTEPHLQELYNLLPYATKREIRNVWKSDNMMIPADQLNMIMGYRKASVTGPFGLDPQERNVAQQVLVTVAEAILGPKAALRLGRAEDVIQELVREAKDILVVKNIFTLVGNIVSNMTLLAWSGVDIADAVRAHATGIKGALQYRADNKRLIQLVQAKEIGYVPEGVASIDDEIVVLRDRIARNPIKPLIDAGLMPTIVEDVEADDSQYSYKSLLQQKTERVTSKLPKLVRDAAKFVYVAHDTSMYKFLSQTTQLSDLVARYTLYEHLINRSRDPLSKADALKQAEESFVNYDIPSHRMVQYLNDTGLLMFTKYYLRIQKVIARLVKEKPARGLALVVANHFVSGLQSVMDSSWINRIGHNPFQSGPFAFPSSLSELPAIKGLFNL
ncbi:virion RNA polymerase [Pseudomonas phage KPP21]|uniref:Putative virion RNA polymerase n=1 Tax=Pseudomonas phage KPP21 TaxID=1678082 RepID=A0A0H5AXZ1_BPK21|nr:virion RNA polymerase [Pseudomonas phage KPP21]BAR94673.1 putative virion RNA polymerase [Pseudomonas phage KPP21]